MTAFPTTREEFLREVDFQIAASATEAVEFDIGDLARKLGEKIFSWVEKNVRDGICCWGLSQIDTRDERKEAGKKVRKYIGSLIPAPYSLALPLVGPLVEKFLILPALEKAADEGAEYCKDVVCEVAPFPNPLES